MKIDLDLMNLTHLKDNWIRCLSQNNDVMNANNLKLKMIDHYENLDNEYFKTDNIIHAFETLLCNESEIELIANMIETEENFLQNGNFLFVNVSINNLLSFL